MSDPKTEKTIALKTIQFEIDLHKDLIKKYKKEKKHTHKIITEEALRVAERAKRIIENMKL